MDIVLASILFNFVMDLELNGWVDLNPLYQYAVAQKNVESSYLNCTLIISKLYNIYEKWVFCSYFASPLNVYMEASTAQSS